MSDRLNVLIAESHEGAAQQAASVLDGAGHRVHRCFEPGQHGFSCTAVREGVCPLDGPIDVAYVKRTSTAPDPTPLEDGVRCALRQGVPVVAELVSQEDSLASYLTQQLDPGDDVIAACTTAAVERYEPLRQAILTALEPTMVVAGLPIDQVECRIEASGDRMLIVVSLPPVADRKLDEHVAVRAAGAASSVRHPFSVVDVSVRHRQLTTA